MSRPSRSSPRFSQAGTASSERAARLPSPCVDTDPSPWPRVTVVTPSYNQGQYLERTIRSVIGQGYPNLEYMIVDGGSTDGSVDIVRRYEPWLAYWVSEPDSGPAEAINKGLRRASGEILAWLNSDDVYHPGAVLAAVRALQAQDADLVCGRCRLISARGRLIDLYVPHLPVTSRSLLMIWEYHCAAPPQPTVFFRRAVPHQIGLLDEDLQYAFDHEYWLRALDDFRFVYSPDVWADYRIHPESKTGKGWRPFAREIGQILPRYWSRLSFRDRLKVRLLGRRRVRVRPYLDHAFDAYQEGNCREIGRWLHRAFWVDPTQLTKRGNLSIYRRYVMTTLSDLREVLNARF